MALVHPMALWDVVSGTWGTDIDESTTVLKSGVRSINFLNTTPAADPELARSREGWMSVEEGRAYKFDCVVRADSITAGDTVGMLVDWLDISEVTLSTSTVHNAVLSAANAWERKSNIFAAPSNARWAKPRLTKNNTAFNAYFDSVEWAPALSRLVAWLSTVQTIVNNTPTVVVYDTVTTNVQFTFDTGTGIATCKVPGRYFVQAEIQWNSISAGVQTKLEIIQNSTTKKVTEIYGSGSVLTLPASRVLDLVEGDTIKAQCFHLEGVDRDLLDDANYSFLDISQIE